MSETEIVSNQSNQAKEIEREDQQLHEITSSETQSQSIDIEDQFEGMMGRGEIEPVPKFNKSRALNEGFDFQERMLVTEDMENLPDAGAGEFQRPESVCGSDDRIRISSLTSMPWRWICQLIITKANGRRSLCTGWFIGPRTVMTSGHCVYSHSAGGWARKIEVFPGIDENEAPLGSQVSTSFRSVKGWTQEQDDDFDYGAIILPDDTLGNRVGWFGFANLSDDLLTNLLINNSGYAGDKPFGTQWFNAGRITRISGRKLSYMLDTYGGQSGSPVWRLQDGQHHVVGIHGYGGCPNSAVRITKSVFDNMSAWKNV
ncbi:MAG: serine protease [Moorea sp. SIO3I7]|uniref:trypsin-like serine peptidase n=1 Tax=unclassified Moorena TaxID=2683338 RepID=UPI0013BF373C|nr:MULTISPECIES: serine protease [unclassified Moorena]NEO01562.1 serine protease [Moorena sp. SIO3I7]NEO09304.1 serine protease [Moorena sp. SIO3I8]NEO21721.1 serine protease [Moorena sp. SIO4A5]NEP21893.1 serine protease [Moorena sp. SIO3I6]NEQ57650.1 serine protease [Moorena sp. SIO4A1]